MMPVRSLGTGRTTARSPRSFFSRIRALPLRKANTHLRVICREPRVWNLMIPPLEPPDSHHLAAAQGWLELGNHAEANNELERISPTLRAHPDALEVSWQIYAAAK